MSSFFEFRIDNFDMLYNRIATNHDGFGRTNNNHVEYTMDAAKSQLDTDTGHNDSYSYLGVPGFDSPLSSLSPSLSTYSSRINTPTRDENESVASENGAHSNSDSDIESLSLSGEEAAIGNTSYFNVPTQYDEEDKPWVPPPSPPRSKMLTHNLRRRNQVNVVTAPTFDSDDEAVVESDSGGGTDDEYVPTPRLKPLKRRRSPEPDTPSSHSIPSVASSSRAPSPVAARPTKRQRISRNGRRSQASKKSRKPVNWTAEDAKVWSCPRSESGCDYVQYNRRTPDLRRHIRTHTRAENPTPYVCWGVLLGHAGASKRPIPADKRGIPVEYQGEMRIGGCLKSFSRADALKRHLETTKIGQGCTTDYDDFNGVRED